VVTRQDLCDKRRLRRGVNIVEVAGGLRLCHHEAKALFECARVNKIRLSIASAGITKRRPFTDGSRGIKPDLRVVHLSFRLRRNGPSTPPRARAAHLELPTGQRGLKIGGNESDCSEGKKFQTGGVGDARSAKCGHIPTEVLPKP
jgi:hypothetical protein